MNAPQSTSADEAAAAALRADIVSGVYSVRERLPEVELASHYGASRAAIRSALVQLEREGLVERRPNRGARVRGVPLEEAVEIIDVRMVLEGLCAAKAAELATDRDREDLRRLMVEMKAAVADGDDVVYARLNRTLHARVREISQQNMANKFISLLRNQFVQHQYRLSMLPGRLQVSVHEHDAVARAIIAGDAAGAEVAMRDHLQSVKATMIASYEVSQAALG